MGPKGKRSCSWEIVTEEELGPKWDRASYRSQLWSSFRGHPAGTRTLHAGLSRSIPATDMAASTYFSTIMEAFLKYHCSLLMALSEFYHAILTFLKGVKFSGINYIHNIMQPS